MSNTPQEWLSELEADERRALILDSLVEARFGGHRSDEAGLAELADVTSQLLAKPWLQALTFEELKELNAIHPRWDWYSLLHFEEGVQPATLQEVVKEQLRGAVAWLVEEGDEMIVLDLWEGTDRVAENLDYCRCLATACGFDLRNAYRL